MIPAAPPLACRASLLFEAARLRAKLVASYHSMQHAMRCSGCLLKRGMAERQVWAPMHWMDTNKVPEKWREGQYPKDILRYNRLTSPAARAGNLTVFDTYNLTKGGATLDGVHVPAPVSLVKLQLLLGMVEARHAAPAASLSAAS